MEPSSRCLLELSPRCYHMNLGLIQKINRMHKLICDVLNNQPVLEQNSSMINDLLFGLNGDESRRFGKVPVIPVMRYTQEYYAGSACFGNFDNAFKEAVDGLNRPDKTSEFVFTCIGRNQFFRSAVSLIGFLMLDFKNITVNIVDSHEGLSVFTRMHHLFSGGNERMLLGDEPASDLNMTTKGDLLMFVRFMEIVRFYFYGDAKINFVLYPDTGSYLEYIYRGKASKADCLLAFKYSLYFNRFFGDKNCELPVEKKWKIFTDDYDLFLKRGGILGFIHEYTLARNDLMFEINPTKRESDNVFIGDIFLERLSCNLQDTHLDKCQPYNCFRRALVFVGPWLSEDWVLD